MNDYNNILITSCKSNQKPSLIAYTLGTLNKEEKTVTEIPEKIKTLTNYELKQSGFKAATKIKKMPLQDIFAVLGYTDIILVHFSKENNLFEQYHIFELLHKNFISDALFSGDCLFSICEKDVYLHEIRFVNESRIADDVLSIITGEASTRSKGKKNNYKKSIGEFFNSFAADEN